MNEFDVEKFISELTANLDALRAEIKQLDEQITRIENEIKPKLDELNALRSKRVTLVKLLSAFDFVDNVKIESIKRQRHVDLDSKVLELLTVPKTQLEIAKEIGVASSTVYHALCRLQLNGKVKKDGKYWMRV